MTATALTEFTTKATMLDEDMLPTPPDVSHLITEDDTPVDNLFSEKQMRLLAESLYTSWSGPGEGRTFLVMANVGLFSTPHQPALVPDVLLSLDVRPPENLFPKEHRSYFIWEYGKPPEVIVEIVSNRKGGELGNKLLDYARMGISYYVVYDPEGHISEPPLRLFARQGAHFAETTDAWLDTVGLGLVLWEGEYEGASTIWLRWCNQAGELYATGAEALALAQQKIGQERQRAEQMAARLRALGIDPDA